MVAEPAVEPEAHSGPARPPVKRSSRVVLAVTTVLPVGLIVYLGTQSGGFPRGVVAAVATLLALLLALRALLAPETVQYPGRVGMAGAGALLVLALWQLASAEWSDSTWRAVAEFNRTVLYFIAYLTFATLPKGRLKPVLASVGVGVVVLALLALVSRLRPDLIAGVVEVSPQRLSYPLGYWNALGVLVAFGLVLCLHASADGTWPLVARVAGAALFPALAATLYFTLSRGGIGAAALGIALYAVLGRPAVVAAGAGRHRGADVLRRCGRPTTPRRSSRETPTSARPRSRRAATSRDGAALLASARPRSDCSSRPWTGGCAG